MSPKEIIDEMVEKAKAAGAKVKDLRVAPEFHEELEAELGKDPSEHYGFPIVSDSELSEDGEDVIEPPPTLH